MSANKVKNLTIPSPNTCLFIRKPWIPVLLNINDSTVLKPHFGQQVLHHDIVSVGIYAQVSALPVCPFQTKFPYALYRAEGYISANLARKVTGFSEEDLELLWEAIINMFEHDHSAARGKMAGRELIVFKHSKELGDCPAYRLFDAVEVSRKDGVVYPRKYQDYVLTIHEDAIPETVEMSRKI